MKWECDFRNAVGVCMCMKAIHLNKNGIPRRLSITVCVCFDGIACGPPRTTMTEIMALNDLMICFRLNLGGGGGGSGDFKTGVVPGKGGRR